ncbi:hypothetical protein JOM56_014315 [Amanita muscaria]
MFAKPDKVLIPSPQLYQQSTIIFYISQKTAHTIMATSERVINLLHLVLHIIRDVLNCDHINGDFLPAAITRAGNDVEMEEVDEDFKMAEIEIDDDVEMDDPENNIEMMEPDDNVERREQVRDGSIFSTGHHSYWQESEAGDIGVGWKLGSTHKFNAQQHEAKDDTWSLEAEDVGVTDPETKGSALNATFALDGPVNGCQRLKVKMNRGHRMHVTEALDDRIKDFQGIENVRDFVHCIKSSACLSPKIDRFLYTATHRMHGLNLSLRFLDGGLYSFPVDRSNLDSRSIPT